jgi:hypothetical protein
VVVVEKYWTYIIHNSAASSRCIITKFGMEILPSPTALPNIKQKARKSILERIIITLLGGEGQP